MSNFYFIQPKINKILKKVKTQMRFCLFWGFQAFSLSPPPPKSRKWVWKARRSLYLNKLEIDFWGIYFLKSEKCILLFGCNGISEYLAWPLQFFGAPPWAGLREKKHLVPFVLVFIAEIFPLKTSGSFFTTGNSTFIFLTLSIIVGFIEYQNRIESKS